jgi:acyl-CoA thioesterase FadM
MAKLAYELGFHAITATLDVRFKSPAPIQELLTVFGEITDVDKRMIKGKARVVKEDGTVLATATSILLRRKASRVRTP